MKRDNLGRAVTDDGNREAISQYTAESLDDEVFTNPRLDLSAGYYFGEKETIMETIMEKTVIGAFGCVEMSDDDMQNVSGGHPLFWIFVGLAVGHYLFTRRPAGPLD